MRIKKTWLLLLVVLCSATTGYVVGRSAPPFAPPKRAGVTGIGGIFFKSKDPAALKKNWVKGKRIQFIKQQTTTNYNK